MEKKERLLCALCGGCAGIVNGLLGAGGGMVLVPMLTKFVKLQEDEVFPASIAIIFPICLISLLFSGTLPEFSVLWPYLLGSALGGIVAGFLGKHIRPVWLHRILGIFILWGGVRYLWP